MREFRIGCVGIGGRGRSMIQWVSDGIDHVKAVAVCDSDPDKFYKPFFNGRDTVPPLQEALPGVTYYQDYVVDVIRRLSLKSLEVSCGGDAVSASFSAFT